MLAHARLVILFALIIMTSILEAVAGAQSNAFAFTFGTLGTASGQFSDPNGLGLDAAGNIYVADRMNNRIQVFDAAGNFLSAFGSAGTGDGQFQEPTVAAVDYSGNIYVVDSSNARIQVFNPGEEFLYTFGSFGSGNLQFNFPQGLAFGPADHVYVADANNSRVEVLDAGGDYDYQFGNGMFNDCREITIDDFGNVYVADRDHHRVLKFDLSGNYLDAIGSYGTGNGQLAQPRDLATDATGSLYVVDSSNNRIQKFDANGNYAGQFGTMGSGNGQFNLPFNIALNRSAGMTYVADAINNRVEAFYGALFGIDVSTINSGGNLSVAEWSALREFDGKQFVVATAWDGRLKVNAAPRLKNALSAGLKTAATCVVGFDNANSSGASQVSQAFAALGGQPVAFMAIAAESNVSHPSVLSVPAQVARIADAIAEVRHLGVPVVLYARAGDWQTLVGANNDEIGGVPVWELPSHVKTDDLAGGNLETDYVPSTHSYAPYKGLAGWPSHRLAKQYDAGASGAGVMLSLPGDAVAAANLDVIDATLFRLPKPTGAPKLFLSVTSASLSSGVASITLSVANTGLQGALACRITSASLSGGAALTTALPVRLATIAAGAKTSTILTFSGATGNSASLALSGTYGGGTFSTTMSVKP